MGIKSRLIKLEQKVKIVDNEIIFILDDIVTFKEKEYKEEEFYKLYPHFKKTKVIEWC